MLIIFSNKFYSQSTYGPKQSDLRRNLYSLDFGPAQSNGLLNLEQNILFGSQNITGGPEIDRYRAIYQWNIEGSEIPEGSIITLVNISFAYEYYPAPMTVYFYNISSDIINPDLQPIFNFMNTPSNSMFSSEETSYKTFDLTFTNPNHPLMIAIQNSLLSNRFTLGLAEGNYCAFVWSIKTPTVKLKIEFTPPEHLITINQKLNNNQQVGLLRKWDEGTLNFTAPFNPGSQIPLQVFSYPVILGDQNLISYQKYHDWDNDLNDVKNHHKFYITSTTEALNANFIPPNSGITIKNSLEGTTLDGGQIRIKDPWLIDYTDPDYANTLRNRGMDIEGPDKLEFRNQTSPFTPDLTSAYNGYIYKGIFLNQSGPPFWNNTYYSVGSLSEQTISVNNQNRKFYPFKWGGTGVTIQGEYWPETGIVFNNSSAAAIATLKGQLMSNSTSGISSNSQRKIVRTDNGIYHVIYESMGNVFYTHSLTSNFDGVWAADQLLIDNAKNPAIEYDGNIVKAVCEYYDPLYTTEVKLYLFTFIQGVDGKYYLNPDEEVFATCPSSYFGSVKPVISYNSGQISLVYRKNSTEGLKISTKRNSGGVWSWLAEATIPETNANSINPSIIGENGKLHIAFESLLTIKYKMGYYRGGSAWEFDPLITLSSGTGYSSNFAPSISLCQYTYPYVMVSWRGHYSTTLEKNLSKTEDYSIDVNAAVAKVGYGTSWGGSSSFSNNVNYTNNNSLNSSLGSILTWSESSGSITKFVKRNSNGTYGTITNLSVSPANGIQSFVSNGSNFSEMEAMVFNTSTSAPYLLNRCTNDFSQGALEKVVEGQLSEITFGRSGVVEKNGVEFLFNIGDVLLDGQSIGFIERIDTLPVADLTELNSSARTNIFNLNSGSELIFSDYYYVVNKSSASNLTDEFSLTFKCELVNAATNQVVGTFDNVTYNKFNVQEYDNPSYLVDCSGIESGSYYLRLNTAVNEEVNLYVGDIQRDDIVLEKQNLIVRNFKGEGIPTSYDLAQNYPNPFNPSTTIRYQLPQDGIVTLKIYDVLGSEIATLVNEEKVAGKYEVNFNASSLASGVYIYKIQAGEFVSSKKMMLLK